MLIFEWAIVNKFLLIHDDDWMQKIVNCMIFSVVMCEE